MDDHQDRRRGASVGFRSGDWRGVGIAFGSAVVAGAATLALHVQAEARRTEREHPPLGRFIEADGLRLHYIELGQGDAPPVVLLHGVASMVEDFLASGLVEHAAARGRRVVVFDRPGFGHSPRPRDRVWTAEAQAAVLVEACRGLGVERPVVLGHSWGTLVALAMALDHPDAVHGLVLLSGFYYPVPRADVPVFAPPAVPVLGDALRYTVFPTIAQRLAPDIIEQTFAPAPVPARFTEFFPVSMALRPSHLRASAEDITLMIPTAAALARRYGELRLPVALLAGTEDRIVQTECHSVRLHREVEQSRLTLVPGDGHMVHYGAPELVAEAIDAIAAAQPWESKAVPFAK